MVTAAWYSVLMEEGTRVPGDGDYSRRLRMPGEKHCGTEWAAFPPARGPDPNLAERPVPAAQAGLVRRVCQWAGGSGSRNQGRAQLGPESRRLNGPMAVATGLLGRPFESACRKCRSLGFILRAQVFRVGSPGALRTSSVRRESGELASLDALPRP
jgi:hypothetical protein